MIILIHFPPHLHMFGPLRSRHFPSIRFQLILFVRNVFVQF